MTQDHDSEFRMILSHAFLGSDASGIGRETWDLAISGCVKYLESQLKSAPLPDDIKQWIEDEAEKLYPKKELDTWKSKRTGFIAGATAMHDLLSPQIESLKSSLSASERFRMEDTWDKINKIEEQRKEIERLKEEVGEYIKLGGKIFDKGTDIAAYWKQRCEAAEYLISPDAHELEPYYSRWRTIKNTNQYSNFSSQLAEQKK